MKTPLRYQISEYDCGPTAFLNAVSFLFEREQISPELIRSVMLYSLDSYGAVVIRLMLGVEHYVTLTAEKTIEYFI